jgi:hypothetical protein
MKSTRISLPFEETITALLQIEPKKKPPRQAKPKTQKSTKRQD